jgi:hypothetical protein
MEREERKYKRVERVQIKKKYKFSLALKLKVKSLGSEFFRFS